MSCWIVTAPVARAVAVLERFQPPDGPYLFAHPLKSANHQRHHVAGRVRTSANTIKDITALAKWINSYWAARSRLDTIPEDNGRLPRLTPRQYRHQRIQMFEGYAGTNDSGFRDEVGAEEAFACGQFFAEMGADDDRPAQPGRRPKPGSPSSPATRSSTVRLSPTKSVYAATLTRHDSHLYPGIFITCVYNPDRALCRRPEGPADQPVMADCQPLTCRNTALTPANRQAFVSHLVL
ncbi:hypothetical protein ACWEQC_10450 [Streptomyces shenzhenensis]